ncbi:MAG: ABC-2 family transporter protein [Chthonomonas sp.]|nr:ABC-2 family transporter protein [Chthonomonas sp.]
MGFARSLRHFGATVRVVTQEVLTYPAQMAIWVLTDAVTCFTMPLVMALVAGSGQVRGYSASDFALYYIVMLVVTSWVVCHVMWEIMTEMREGQFSSQLLRPTSYLGFVIARNLAWRVQRTVLTLPVIGLMVLCYWSYLRGAQLHFSLGLVVSLVLAQWVSVMFCTAFAMLALFVEDATSIFELHYFPMLFLSGQIFPIEMLPTWAKQASYFLPFYYTTAFPTEMVLGKVPEHMVWPLIGGQVVWIVLCYAWYRVMFRAGTKVYSGVGM